MMSFRLQRRWSIILAVCGLALVAGPLQAQDAPDDSPAALFQSGMSRFVSGDYENSVQYLEQLVKVFGKEPELRTQIDLAMYARACALYNLSRWADAIKAFEEYSTQFPESKFADEAIFRIGSAQTSERSPLDRGVNPDLCGWRSHRHPHPDRRLPSVRDSEHLDGRHPPGRRPRDRQQTVVPR